MTTISDRLALRLAGVPRYQPGVAGSGPASRKLSSNEAALGPGPKVTSAIARGICELAQYPDESPLRSMLAASIGASAEEIVLTNGSDELCSLVASLFLSPQAIAVVGDPAYQIDVKVTLLAGAEVRSVPLVKGRHDLAAMARAAADAALVWLPSPHNPTGIAIKPADLEAFIESVPSNTLIVVDQAYYAFADPEFQIDALAICRMHPNVLFQRTLSKDAALAGARIGYGLGSPAIIEALARVRAPFSVNSVALIGARASLEDDAWRHMAVTRIREGRSLLEAELARLGVDFIPSQANFVLAKVPYALIGPALAAVGISVRPGEDLAMPGWVRITIGWAPIMADLRKILRRAFGGAG